MTELSDFIEKTNAASSSAALFRQFTEAIQGVEYDRFVFNLLTEGPMQDDDAQPWIYANYPEDWVAHYVSEGYAGFDPIRRLTYVCRGPATWRDALGHASLTPQELNVMREARDAGLHRGIGIPLHGPYGEVAGVGLATSNENADPPPDLLSLLSLYSYQLYIAYCHLSGRSGIEPAIRLTPREREVLLWCARGKSNWAIGNILNISEHGAKFHVSNCIAKLGTGSRITAVLKAIRLGLIDP